MELFLKEKSEIIPEKMRILNGFANRKGWVLSMRLLSQVLFDRMAILNGNSPPFSIWYVSCLTGGKFSSLHLRAEVANIATILENSLLT